MVASASPRCRPVRPLRRSPASLLLGVAARPAAARACSRSWRRLLGVDMREQVHAGRAPGRRSCARAARAAIVSAASRAARTPSSSSRPALGQLPLQQPDRVVRAPGLDLAVAAVAGGVVGVRVRVDAVRDGLDQGRAAAAPRALRRPRPQHLADRDRVVAVDQPAAAFRTRRPCGRATARRSAWPAARRSRSRCSAPGRRPGPATRRRSSAPRGSRPRWCRRRRPWRARRRRRP